MANDSDATTNSLNNHEACDDDGRDDLDDLIAEIASKNPEFPAMVEAAMQRRRAARARGEDPNDLPPSDDATEEEAERESGTPNTAR